jgi:oxysterol-binding protein 1
MAHQHPAGRGHSARLSTASAIMARTPSFQNTSAGTSKSNIAADKSVSLEQSVRKFRIVEALRSGDTASISKAIRETAEGGPRASTSSATTTSAGPLDDTTILHLAIQCAEFPVVEYVLSDGAAYLDVNAKDKDGNTPLHIAASQGRTQIVRLLLEQKDINDAMPNYHGRLAIDMARNPDIFQQLQLSRSLFAESKVRQVQDLVVRGDYKALEQVLEEPRLKTVLDINSTEFASEPITVQSGGTLLHEAARRRNKQLIQVLLLHGADPFRRDRKGRLPQDVTKDDVTRAMLKRSPAAVAAQRGIQEKAVLGHAASQGAATATPGDPVVGKESREMKGYLKKWTNYRKGYQLRWFVLEDGVLSYYKHQDDAGSACRGAINMRIAKLLMSPDEKTKFEIIGKSSVKYTLKANHEVEAKRWFWALNNSIQWTKDQAKAEERQKARSAELLRQAKNDQNSKTPELSINEPQSENASVSERRNSSQMLRSYSSAKISAHKSEFAGTSTAGSIDDDMADFDHDDQMSKAAGNGGPAIPGDDDDDDDFGDDVSTHDAPTASKDAFNITAQSARLQLETISQVNAALVSEASRSPNITLTDPKVSQALSTYDAAIRSLTGLVGDLLRISKDRDAYWQYRLDRETDMRRMWEESMAKVAHEQEELEARVGEAEMKRKLTKRALRDVMESGLTEPPLSSQSMDDSEILPQGADDFEPQKSPTKSITRRQTLAQIANLSDSESEDEEEFFDAVDAGEVEVAEMPPSEAAPLDVGEKAVIVSGGLDLSSSFKGYENGIRKRLKMDADDRPKISLWVSQDHFFLGFFFALPPLPPEPHHKLTQLDDAGHLEIHDRKGHDKDDLARLVQRADVIALPLRRGHGICGPARPGGRPHRLD